MVTLITGGNIAAMNMEMIFLAPFVNYPIASRHQANFAHFHLNMVVGSIAVASLWEVISLGAVSRLTVKEIMSVDMKKYATLLLAKSQIVLWATIGHTLTILVTRLLDC